MKKTTLFALFLLASILLAACETAPRAADAYPSYNSPAYDSDPAVADEAIDEAIKEVPLPTAAPTELPADEYPPAALAAREALAKMLELNVESIEIQTIQPSEWPDSCLGLGGPSEMCTQALVPGFRVTLLADGAQYIYRTNQSGGSVRREGGLPRSLSNPVVRALVNWQSPQCDREASLQTGGLSLGACGGPYRLVPWEEGSIPAAMREWLDTYASFNANTPAGRLIFKGQGTEAADPVEQRAVAEWMNMQFSQAQPAQAGQDWGLALSYQREGGLAGFCDEVKVYLDGHVLISGCKDVDVTFRLDPAQLEQVYAWYDNLGPIDFSHRDPAIADALSTSLSLPARGSEAAAQDVINAIQDFCVGLIEQGRTVP